MAMIYQIVNVAGAGSAQKPGKIVLPQRVGKLEVTAGDALEQAGQATSGRHARVRNSSDTATHALATANQRIQLEFDEGLARPVAKIIDKETNEVIRQIPTEEARELAERFEALVGALFDSAT